MFKLLCSYFFTNKDQITDSFVGFLDIIPILRDCTSPRFHIIVPSLPGYAFSSTPPLNRDFTFQDAAYLVNELMVGLGLDGYVAQGGDIGSFIAEALAAGYRSCRGKSPLMIHFM